MQRIWKELIYQKQHDKAGLMACERDLNQCCLSNDRERKKTKVQQISALYM